jgi:SAM-dependent methyltransferase
VKPFALKRADYGVDAPSAVLNMVLVGTSSILGGVIAYYLLVSIGSLIAMTLLSGGLLFGGSLLAISGLMIWSSKIGKRLAWERLFDALALRGDEIVLDVGCGRGLVLNTAAKRLTTGKAIGIDLWQCADQSGNHPGVTRANAQTEGIAGRVDIQTGDMQELPFADASVDLVVASMAIHNIADEDGRARAVHEIARVLKPRGQVALLDFKCTEEYEQILLGIHWEEVGRSGLRFEMFPPVRVVMGRKPKADVKEQKPSILYSVAEIDESNLLRCYS